MLQKGVEAGDVMQTMLPTVCTRATATKPWRFCIVHLEKDVVMNFSAFEGKRIIDYSLQMTGSEIIKSPLGEFKCKIVKPFRDGKNLFKNSGDMRIWISNDKQRLPVKIQIKMKVGTMTLLLKEIN